MIDYRLFLNISILSFALFPFCLPTLMSLNNRKIYQFVFLFCAYTAFFSYKAYFPLDSFLIKGFDMSIFNNLLRFQYLFLILILACILERIFTRIVFSIPMIGYTYIPRKPMDYISAISFPIAEELIYRGVLFSLVYELSNSLILSVVVSSISYGIGHYFFGVMNIITKCFLGVAFSLAFFQSENIIFPIFLHICYNIYIIVYDIIFGRKVILKKR